MHTQIHLLHVTPTSATRGTACHGFRSLGIIIWTGVMKMDKKQEGKTDVGSWKQNKLVRSHSGAKVLLATPRTSLESFHMPPFCPL